MRFVKKHSIFLILIFFFTIVLSQANHVSQTVQLRVFLNENSFTIVVEDNQNDLGQSISLRDFGFSYEYYEESRNTKLSNYRGFEAAFDRIEPGTCIFVRVDDPNLSISLPSACVGVPIEISVHIADRFWYIPEDDDFRPITFSNSFTDQQCRIRSSACTIRFEQNAESADSGQISGADELNTEIESISTIPFGGGEDTSLVLEANGKSAIIRKADCATTAHPDDFPEHEITVFAVCDANGEEAEFFIHNPDGELIEWVVWRVLPQHLPEGTPETPSETATPDPNFDPDVITGDVSVVQSNLRDGPGTDFPPDARFPFVAEGTRIELTGRYVDLDTHQLWYQGILGGRTIWVFANNVSVNGNVQPEDLNRDNIPISIPEPPQLPDEDSDGVPDIEDVCPDNPNASRRSECPDESSGISNNRDVVNPPMPAPLPSINAPVATQIIINTNTPVVNMTTVTPTITNTPTSVITDCILTVNIGANVRTYPEYGSIVGGGLVAGTTMVITQKMTGAPEGDYYHVGSGWVVGSAVSLSGNCNVLSTEIYVPQAVTATYTPTNTPGVPPPPPPPPIPGCIAPEITSASAGPVNNGTLPFNPTVNFSLCLNSGQEVWVIVHPITDSNYGWGPTGGSGSMGVNLGTGAGSQCGDSFELRVVIATIGSIQNSTAYGTVPGVVASRTIGTYTKSCT